MLILANKRTTVFKNPPFDSGRILKQKGRGAMEELISDDGEVILTKWFDNKPLHMASTFVGIGDKDQCKTWDKKEKEYIPMPRPEVVKWIS